MEKKALFVLREKAVPEVLLKVAQAKQLLDSGRAASVAVIGPEATPPESNAMEV